MMDSSEV